QPGRKAAAAVPRVRGPGLHRRRVPHSLAQPPVARRDRAAGCQAGRRAAQSQDSAQRDGARHRRVLNHRHRVASGSRRPRREARPLMTSLPSLRDVADAADAAGFVGRANEIQLLKRVLDQASPSRIFYVHGPGGIGKSALLRAARRIATAEGATVASLDGRTLPLDLDLLRARVLEAAQAADVVILDEADTLGSALAPLRD